MAASMEEAADWGRSGKSQHGYGDGKEEYWEE
jgi:hypothetical protein